MFNKNISKFFRLKLGALDLKRGMSYVELIVVLAIMGIMSSVVLFNNRDFEKKIEIKNLTNDIALRIVEAQKSAMSGKIPDRLISLPNWKPSYGVYFSRPSTGTVSQIQNFVYFVDLNGDKTCIDPCDSSNSEYLDSFSIQNGNYISKLYIPDDRMTADSLSILFTRPDSGAYIIYDNKTGSPVSSAQIEASSGGSVTSLVIVEASGRIRIN